MAKSTNTNILAKIFFGSIAIWAVPLYQGGKYLTKKSLQDAWGWLLTALVGMPASIAGGIYAGHGVGWKTYPAVAAWSHGWMPHFLWATVGIVAGALAWLVLLTYAWSLTYLIVIKPVTIASDKIGEFFADLSRRHYQKCEDIFLGAIKSVFQPSFLWSSVQAKDAQRTWLRSLLTTAGRLCIFAGSLYLGWLTLMCVHATFVGALGLWVWLPAALAAGFVVLTVGSIFSDFMDYGRLAFTAVVSGAAGAYALTPLLVPVAKSILHLPAATTANPVAVYWGIFAVDAMANVAYVFPIVYLLLTGGFIKKIAEAVLTLLYGVLDEKKTNFRRLFHGMVTVATVWRFATVSLMLWGLLGLPGTWSIGLAMAVAALTYILVGKLLDSGVSTSIGNSLIGFLGSAHLGGWAGYRYAQAGCLFGIWGGIAVGVLTFLALFFVAYPVSYKCLRQLFDLTGLSWLGKPLGWLHDQAWKGFSKVMRKFEEVYEWGYWKDGNDTAKSDFRQLFLYASNLVLLPVGFIAGTLCWKALGLVSALTVPAGVVTALLAYLLIGQVIKKGGTRFVGSVTSIIAAYGAGVWSFDCVPFTTTVEKIFVAFPVGVLAWLAMISFGVPATFLVLRCTLGWSTSFALPLLRGVYEASWKDFDKLVWQPFLVVYRFIRDYFWRPIWHLFVYIWSTVWNIWLGIWNGVKETWASMFGRKNRRA